MEKDGNEAYSTAEKKISVRGRSERGEVSGA
jgi:hypothetical protein